MKIALAQVNCHIGNFENNRDKALSLIGEARAEGADLIVFPELFISGYPPLDFLEFSHFTNQCHQMIDDIAVRCTDIDAVIGTPTVNPVLLGKNLFNSACFISNGKVKQVIHKTLLPTYDVFDEHRYFEPNNKFEIIVSGGKKIALTICEDLWNEEDDPMYTFSPMDHLFKQHPDLIINIAASPFDHTHESKRKAILKRNVLKYQLPLIYVNHVGGQTDLLFDGGSLVYDRSGGIAAELEYFKEELRIIDIDSIQQNEPAVKHLTGKPEKIYQALIMGLRDYFSKMGFRTATLGLSGGIDSALVLKVAFDAIGKENVYPVLMPSQFSSDHSVNDAMELCKNLGIEYDRIGIKDIYDVFMASLDEKFKDTGFGVAEENIQARIRGAILMALSNKFGHILLNTSNKSELAVGYGTLYGDMNGGISVIGDLYKTDVYELSSWINRNEVVIPEQIIKKEPSAELRPEQKDTDTLPPYELLDKILYQYIEMRKGYDQILAAGHPHEIVKKVLKLVNQNEYKRFQFAPVLRVSPKCFGFGRRMPLVAKYLG